MVILITLYSTAEGGAEISTIDLCNYLARVETVSKVIFLLATSYPSHLLIGQTSFEKKVVLYPLKINLFLWNILSFFVVLLICLKERPDIVQTNFRSVLGESLAGKILGKKVISSLRVILIDRNNLNSFKFVDHIIGVSRAVIERVRILGWKKETAVIYNGLDLKQIDLGKLPDKLVNKNKIYFLSRLVRWKRPEMFVRAATQIHSEIPETEFVIFGKGPKEAVLADMIKNSSASQFLKRGGWVYHFSDLLSSFGIFVLTSYEEPFGRAVVEAVIRGKVVVVPKSGAMPEIFVGYDLLFERDDFADLIKKIRIAYFHYDHYHKQVLRLRKDFLKIYNMERVRQEYLAAYLLDL